MDLRFEPDRFFFKRQNCLLFTCLQVWFWCISLKCEETKEIIEWVNEWRVLNQFQSIGQFGHDDTYTASALRCHYNVHTICMAQPVFSEWGQSCFIFGGRVFFGGCNLTDTKLKWIEKLCQLDLATSLWIYRQTLFWQQVRAAAHLLPAHLLPAHLLPAPLGYATVPELAPERKCF